MGAAFGGYRFVLPPGVSTTVLPAPASTQISIGDLLYWTGSAAQPLSLYTGNGNAVVDQASLAAAFVGVAQQARIAAQTTAGGYPDFPINGIVIGTDVVYEATCASATFECGDLVGIVSSGVAAVGAVSDQNVVAVANQNLAIGYVTNKYTTATTSVRVRLLGKNQAAFANPNYRSVGDSQAVGPGTLAAAAATTLTAASASIQVGVPTAGQDVTLPAVGVSKGLNFFIVNDSAGAFSYTVKNAGGSTIVTVAQSKRALVFCDGAAWYGILTA